MSIRKISRDEMEAIIETRIPVGQFLFEDENHVWAALDNNAREICVEYFLFEENAVQWLKSIDTGITEPEGWEYD